MTPVAVEPQRILVVAALAFEVAGLPKYAPGLRFYVTGAGPDRARRGLVEALHQTRPAWIVGLGLCGGLTQQSRVGSVAVPVEVQAECAGRSFGCERWPALAGRGRMISVNRAAVTPDQKRALGRAHGADWVDMESYAWAQVAWEHEVPLTVVRVVVDTVSDALPQWRDPGSWTAMLSLPAKSFAARRMLHRIARQMLCVS